MTSDYKTVSNARNAGLKFSLPIKGVPISFDGNFSESDFTTWKSDSYSGIRRLFTDDETLNIVQRSADPVLIKGYVDCVIATSPGLHSYYSINGSLITFVAKYNPVGNEGNPIVALDGFKVVGATVLGRGIQAGDKIDFGGVPVILNREGRSAVTITLYTNLGSSIQEIPALPAPPTPTPQTPPLTVEVFTTTTPRDAQPVGRLTVPPGYKILSGGARLHSINGWTFLTASYPESETTWVAAAKAHGFRDEATIEIRVLALKDPDDHWDVKLVSSVSAVAQRPTATATLPNGYVLTGGGAWSHWSGAGNLLTASQTPPAKRVA